jgi:hypothetical protein
MRTFNRVLSVQAVEDRSLPSTLLFVEPGFGYASHAREANFDYNRSEGYAPQGNFSFEEITFRGEYGSTTFIFINNNGYGGDGSGGFQNFPIIVGTGGYGPTPTPTPIPTPTGTGTVSDGGTSSNGGSDGGNFGPTPVAHGATHGTGNTAAPAGAGDVAALLPSQNTTTTTPVNTQPTTNAAQVAAAANGQPAVTLATQPTATRNGGYAITAVTPEADNATPDDVPMPPPSMPLAPAPVPETPGMAVSSGIVAVATSVVGPVAGLVPFDVSSLSTGATQFLDRVTDLAPSWPDSMPAMTDSLWVAAAALLTGGAVHAAAARSAPRNTEPFGKASALSEWERRNGRPC